MIILKCIHPKYFRELSEKRLRQAVPYFLILVLFSLLASTILIVPKLLFVANDFNEAFLGVKETSLETRGPVSIPKENPVLTIDTTGNKTKSTEVLFLGTWT